MIEIRDLYKSYIKGQKRNNVISGINIRVEDGEFLAIMGPSGSGKSTLLNIIGGLDSATKGEYYFDEIKVHKLNNLKLNDFRRDHIGFIFQDYSLLDDCTVYQNIEMPLINIKRKERKVKVLEMLKAFHMEELANEIPDKLSGGEQQRCAIARAIICDNPLILADEPTGALDSENGIAIMKILSDLNKKNRKTIIMVTHDEKVADYADRIIHIVTCLSNI